MSLPVLTFFSIAVAVNLAGQRPTAAPGCASAFEGVDESSELRYSVEDGDFFVTAEVMPNEQGFLPPEIPGQRSLDINLQLKHKAGRSRLRGKDQFGKVLTHFAGKFDQVCGSWTAPVGEELSDNMETFNALTSGPEALAPEAAALKTWFGERASAAGYTRAVVSKLEGAPGNYTFVTVFFKKPHGPPDT